MNIAIYIGYWSTNIGNSFFQLGAEYVLKNIYPQANVFFVGDEQGYIKPSVGNPQNSYNPFIGSKIDYLVILGPFIRPEFFKISAPTIESFFKNGTKIIALGVGMMDYQPETIQKVGEFLKKYPPVLLTTRDSETFEALKNFVPKIYNGIDLGFFVSDIWGKSPEFSGDNYITFNFDQLPEPKFVKTIDSSDKNAFSVGEVSYQIKFNRFRKKWCEKGFLYQLFDQLILPQSKTENLGDYKIIRTDHRYNPVVLKKIYKSPNTYSGDVPYSYLQIYKNTEITFSNRVHACVATLAFGNKAMLFTKSPRAYLLDRVKAHGIKEKPVSIDLGLLQKEKDDLINFIKNNWE